MDDFELDDFKLDVCGAVEQDEAGQWWFCVYFRRDAASEEHLYRRLPCESEEQAEAAMVLFYDEGQGCDAVN